MAATIAFACSSESTNVGPAAGGAAGSGTGDAATSSCSDGLKNGARTGTAPREALLVGGNGDVSVAGGVIPGACAFGQPNSTSGAGQADAFVAK